MKATLGHDRPSEKALPRRNAGERGADGTFYVNVEGHTLVPLADLPGVGPLRMHYCKDWPGLPDVDVFNLDLSR